MSDPRTAREAILAGFSLIRPEGVALISQAISQQLGEPVAAPISNLGRIARQYDKSRGGTKVDAFATDAASMQETLQEILEISKQVVRARGDLSRPEIDDASFARIGELAAFEALDLPENTRSFGFHTQKLSRALENFGVYVDEKHHCIPGLFNKDGTGVPGGFETIGRKEGPRPNAELQNAITAVAYLGKVVRDYKDYYDACAEQRGLQQARSASR